MNSEERKEYERIKGLFSGSDENVLQLIDGAIVEAARLRAELNKLHAVVEKSGLLKINPDNPMMQKELPVSRMLPKVRANYANLIFKMAAILGKDVSEEDLGLEDYE